MIVRVPGFVLVLGLGMVLVGMGLLMAGWAVAGWGVTSGLFGQVCAIVNVNFCRGDSAAVDLFDLEAGVEVQGGCGLVEDGRIDAGINEGSEKHVTTDAGEAVEIGDAHGDIVSRVRRGGGVWIARERDGERFSWDERCR